MKHTLVFKLMLVVLFGFVLGGCKELPPGEYDASEVGKIKKVIPGTIISKRAVNLHKQTSSNTIDSGYNQTHGVEYVIKLNSGSIISVVQSEDLKLKNKQKILVIYGGNTRVVADNGSDAY
jgi:outer membrane lipoprotein SlyB